MYTQFYPYLGKWCCFLAGVYICTRVVFFLVGDAPCCRADCSFYLVSYQGDGSFQADRLVFYKKLQTDTSNSLEIDLRLVGQQFPKFIHKDVKRT